MNDLPRPDTGFVETSTFRLINRTIDRAREFDWNALVIGAPGVGKTRAIAEIVERSDALSRSTSREAPEQSGSTPPRVATIEITPPLGTAVFDLLDRLCDAVCIRRATSLADTEQRLRRLTRWSGAPDTIIFDEAQNLTLKAARILLGISETTHLRMIFVGNPEVLKLVNSAQAAIQQVSRRLPIRETIDAIVDDDADLLASSFGCEGMDAFKALREIGRGHHADGIVTVLKAASKMAALDGSNTIRLRHVTGAADLFPQFRSASSAVRRRRPG